MHVTESLINGNKVPSVIDHRYVEMAWEVVFTLMRGIPKICEQCGLPFPFEVHLGMLACGLIAGLPRIALSFALCCKWFFRLAYLCLASS